MSAKDERPVGGPDDGSRQPRVECAGCHFAWYSVQMAEGLRMMDACPRCGGKLEFADAKTDPAAPDDATRSRFTVAPHLALGIPRPQRR